MAFMVTSCDAGINNKNETSPKDLRNGQAISIDSTRLIHPTGNAPITAADQIGSWYKMLRDKNVAVVGNQTSIVNSSTLEQRRTWDQKEKIRYVHLVDTLLSLEIPVKKVFAPEHGFRGDADAGATVADGIDQRSGLPIISLYGKNKKPSVFFNSPNYSCSKSFGNLEF